MKMDLIKRVGIWLGATIFSFGLCLTFIIATIALSPVFGWFRGQGLFGAGLGFFSVIVIWPGLLTACVILFDRIFLDVYSGRLLARSSAWGLCVSAGYLGALKAGLNISGLAEAIGGRGLGTILYLMLFACPPFLCGYLGIRSGMTK